MFTPAVARLRRNLRQAVVDAFPREEASVVFDKVKQDDTQCIQMADLEKFCETAHCPAAALENVFAPYGVRKMLINKVQWVTFMNDDMCSDVEGKNSTNLTDRQTFIMGKFIHRLKMKFGVGLSSIWNAAIARNPPNTINTTLRLAAFCHLFHNMNLPFEVTEFVDALFSFYGEKIEGITFEQFEALFHAFL